MRTTLQIAVFISFASIIPISPAQSGAQFAKANQEYAAGDFDAALNDYEELVRSGEDTPNLFYNLGNAYFRKKDFGRAILNYERAIALDPRHPEAQANLRIARDEARALELTPTRLQRAFEFATLKDYTVVAAATFWVGAFAIAAAVFRRRRRGGLIALSILSISIFGIACGAVWQLARDRARLAVITTENADARLATADSASRVLTLPAGSEIHVLSQRGDWIYAALPNNLRGWLPSKTAEQVRM